MNDPIVAPDGITWSEYNPDNLVNCWSICYTPPLDIFTAVSYNGYARVLNSSNGIDWAPIIKGDAPGQYPKGWRDIVYGNAIVAVGDNGILLSLNGLNWTKPALPDRAYTSITYSQSLNKFIILGNEISVIFSIDEDLSLTFNQIQIPPGKWSSITYSEDLNLFVAISYYGPNGSMTSSDGITWTLGTLPRNTWSKIIWISTLNQFIAVSNSADNNVYSSVDGLTWVEQDTTGGYWRDLAWSPALNMFTIVSSAYDTNNASSHNGTSFTEYKSRRLSSIEWSDDLQAFVANIVPENLYFVPENFNVLVGKIITPTPTPTPTISITPSITPTISLTPTITQSITPTVTSTITPSTTAAVSPTVTPTPTPTITPTITPTVTQSVTPSEVPI